MDMQAMWDGLAAQQQRERAEHQMTLGSLITRLEELNFNNAVIKLGSVHSYRGHYCDLAFESAGENKISDLLQDCKNAMGQEFRGYRGGDFTMGVNTPVWVAYYGGIGDALLGINDDCTLVKLSKEQK